MSTHSKILQTPICGCFKEVVIDGLVSYIIDRSKPPCPECKQVTQSVDFEPII